MAEYKANSHRSKEASDLPEKKVEKVVHGTVKTRKKTGIEKIKSIFVSEDAGNIKSYVIWDVLIPGLKKAVWDIVTNALDMSLYGGNGNRNRSPASSASYRPYGSFYNRGRPDERRSYKDRVATSYDINNIILETKGEAEDVLSRMDELVDIYGLVSVADLYDLLGTVGSYTDNKYGWTSTRGMDSVRVRDGYLLRLPSPCPID